MPLNDLVTELLNTAFDMGISVVLSKELKTNTPPLADIDKNKIIINLNWYRPRQIPFQICHEIAHIEHHDVNAHVLAFSSILSNPKDELLANTTAIKMLIPRFFDDVELEEINAQDFMDYFDVPSHLRKTVIDIIREYYSL